MRYYLLMYDYENSDKVLMLETDEESLGFDRYEVEKGKQFENWNKNITFYYDTTNGKIIKDYLANNLAWFLVSDKFKGILEIVASDSIQFLPVNVISKCGNAELTDCNLVNIYSIVDALDLENSKYDIFEIDKNELVISIEKYALRRSNLNNANVFRLKDDFVAIFVSEKLKKAIEQNGITGCDFLEVKVV